MSIVYLLLMLPRPSRKALAAWDKLRDDFRDPGGNDADYIDPLDPDDWMRSLCFSARALRPKALFYFAKDAAAFAIGTRWKALLPSNATFVIRPGVAPAHYAAAVRREAIRCRCRARFVGDLDPEDLAVYLSLAFGDYSMRPNPLSAVPIVHAGVNDSWLAAAEKATRSRRRQSQLLELATIEMTDAEERYLEVVEQLGPPLAEWVGPRCASLLKGGKKLEIEGLLNFPAESPSYARGLARVLTGPSRA